MVWPLFVQDCSSLGQPFSSTTGVPPPDQLSTPVAVL
jgi:hypothetical protein